MPIYMDRHDISDEITAEHLARMHQADLKIEHLYGCRGMTYWCDEKRKLAFCLVEAPNSKALEDMHIHAHGGYPHKIIEVDASIVETFLGRIEDPVNTKNTELNIIDDPAFRTLMAITIEKTPSKKTDKEVLAEAIKQTNRSLEQTITKFQGRIVSHKDDCILASFESVTNAVLCTLESQAIPDTTSQGRHLKMKMGLSAGVPVTDKKNLFEDTIKMSRYLSEIGRGNITVTSEVKDIFEGENFNRTIDKSIVVLDLNSEKFLKLLMDYFEKEWNNPSLSVEKLSAELGLSKSQANRKLKSLTDKSPNQFIQEIRLQKALVSIKLNNQTISEIAYESGFTSPTYFSRAFKKRFGLSPSEFVLSPA
ncbi:nickel-binding protein [Chryseolinea sp. T2]|uniref:nickel-binding protein n=1 Tax=Chryseolinea sp. T2 TaxID=3129255 RepID=UPI0030770919